MAFERSSDDAAIAEGIRELCERFPEAYWDGLEETESYPEDFVRALTAGGWLSILIPIEHGGAGLGVTQAALVLEEINRAGGHAAAAHAQMYTMGTLLKHGSEDQKQRYLPEIAAGKLRLQAFGVTEPDAGSETTRIATRAQRTATGYRISGQKVFISRAEHSDLMLLLARTTAYDELEDKTRGLSLFLVDLKRAIADGQVELRRIKVMMNHHTSEVFLNELEVDEANRVGMEGEGFRHIIDTWNVERILVASEAIGDGRWFIERAARYAGERRVFGRPIGMNQGVQFPIAQAYADVEAASVLRDKAAWLYDAGRKCGAEANVAKLQASRASWAAANACLDTYGGYGFAREYHIERKFRETRLYSAAPVSNNLVLAYLAQHVLGMPKSY